MKLWLDDIRCPFAPPYNLEEDEWFWVVNVDEAILALMKYDVDEVSLDHDLGLHPAGDGDEVLKWLISEVSLGRTKVPKISIHSANPVAKERMQHLVNDIEWLLERKHHPEDWKRRAAKRGYTY